MFSLLMKRAIPAGGAVGIEKFDQGSQEERRRQWNAPPDLVVGNVHFRILNRKNLVRI
jgi:hypothetical protein